MLNKISSITTKITVFKLKGGYIDLLEGNDFAKFCSKIARNAPQTKNNKYNCHNVENAGMTELLANRFTAGKNAGVNTPHMPHILL